jgi:hypothetical protein
MRRLRILPLLAVAALALATVLATPAASQEPPPPECSDTIDNDGDTKIDLVDPGCESAEDTTEAPDPPPPLPEPPTVTLTQAPSVASDTKTYTLKATAEGEAGIDRVRFLESGPGAACGDGAVVEVDSVLDPHLDYRAQWTPSTGGERVLKAEAIDNVGQRACDSKVVTVDTGAPSAPTLSISNQGTSAHVATLTVYLDPSGTGSFKVVAMPNDPDVVEVRFPGGKVDNEPNPFSATYQLDEVSEGEKDVVAVDEGGHSSPAAHYEVRFDTTAPTVGVDYAGGNDDDGVITVTGTAIDAGSGVDPSTETLERQLGTLAPGPSCGNLGEWQLTAPENTLQEDQCAFYRFSAADFVGNAAAPDVGAEAAFYNPADTTPPRPVSRVSVQAGDHVVRLRFRVPRRDVALLKIFREIRRVPGSQVMVYSGGRRRKFVDRKSLLNGTRYLYEIVTYDAAANDSRVRVRATPKSRYLRNPRDGATLTNPPRLTWKEKPRASRYNVKVLRNGVTVLSAFPRGESLRLRARWKVNGRVRKLSPGTYFWYVWPRIGSRYGKFMGYQRFTIVRG